MFLSPAPLERSSHRDYRSIDDLFNFRFTAVLLQNLKPETLNIKLFVSGMGPGGKPNGVLR